MQHSREEGTNHVPFFNWINYVARFLNGHMVEKRVVELVEEKIADRADLFLVDVTFHQNGLLSVLVDGDQGVSIEDCAMISRHVGFHLEEENVIDRAYQLEVSSPGIDWPLTERRQYVKNVGRKIQIQLLDEDGVELVREGELLEVADRGILIAAEIKNKNLPKGRKPKTEELVIPFEKIRTTKVLISFK